MHSYQGKNTRGVNLYNLFVIYSIYLVSFKSKLIYSYVFGFLDGQFVILFNFVTGIENRILVNEN